LEAADLGIIGAEGREGGIKSDKQLNRLGDIASHTRYFVSLLKSSFEVCWVHWTLLMLRLRLGLVSQTRNLLPAWRLSKSEEEKELSWREQLDTYMLLFQLLLKVSDIAWIWRRSSFFSTD